MGVVNVTPDSFSDGGRFAEVASAVAHGRQLAIDGAAILDVGGESTRPGADPVDAAEELRRTLPVVRDLVATGVPVSIDTTKASVAEAAVDAGANLINDVWGVGSADALPRLAARRGVPLVVMHNRAEPLYRDLIGEVVGDLRAALGRAVALGVPEDQLIVDPGFGFGKTPEQNLELVRRLHALRALGRPILLGTSRKSTLGRVLGTEPDQRLEATLATTALGIAAGVDMVRVHDVLANVRAARISDAIIRANWRSEPAEGGPH
jgi:dihydropteroate synthase